MDNIEIKTISSWAVPVRNSQNGEQTLIEAFEIIVAEHPLRSSQACLKDPI